MPWISTIEALLYEGLITDNLHPKIFAAQFLKSDIFSVYTNNAENIVTIRDLVDLIKERVTPRVLISDIREHWGQHQDENVSDYIFRSENEFSRVRNVTNEDKITILLTPS